MGSERAWTIIPVALGLILLIVQIVLAVGVMLRLLPP
jgi:hypothetical protein